MTKIAQRRTPAVAARRTARLTHSLCGAAMFGGALLCVVVLPVPEAHSQVPVTQDAGTQVPSAAPVGAVSLGDRGWSESYRATPSTAADRFSFAMRGGIASDYVYRGTSLSDRRPAVG